MIEAPKLLIGRVRHKRWQPKINAFDYGIYYLVLPLGAEDRLPLPYNRPGLLAFYDKDHGPRDGSRLEPWIRAILHAHDIPEADGPIILITLPRLIGYVFNPVSFYLCHDVAGNLRAVLCEVNNTFGESHNYICVHADRRPVKRGDWMEGQKAFHVSPFMEVEGDYRFRFILEDGLFGAWIDHIAADGTKRLTTSLEGRLHAMTRKNLGFAFFRYPLVTLMTTTLIHWQGLKLFLKGIAYVPKPKQREARLTSMKDVTRPQLSPSFDAVKQQERGEAFGHDVEIDPG